MTINQYPWAGVDEALTLASRAAPAAHGDVVVAAGENEDGVDEALAKELEEQEKLFVKCLRKRAEREAKKKMEKEEKKAAAKKLKEDAQLWGPMEIGFKHSMGRCSTVFIFGMVAEPFFL